MKQSDFISKASKVLWKNKVVTKLIITKLFELLSDIMKDGENVTISWFWRFDSVVIGSRKGVNPKTLEPITIPKLTRVKFKPSMILKSKLNKNG